MSTATLERINFSRFLLLSMFFLLLFGYKSCLRSDDFPFNIVKRPNQVSYTPKGGGGSGGIAIVALRKVPKHVRKIIKHLKSVSHMKPPRGFKGGRVFRNREGKLPKEKTYYEFDVHPLKPGISRGAERLVVDQQKSVFYYTKDHYNTFIKIQP